MYTGAERNGDSMLVFSFFLKCFPAIINRIYENASGSYAIRKVRVLHSLQDALELQNSTV